MSDATHVMTQLRRIQTSLSAEAGLLAGVTLEGLQLFHDSQDRTRRLVDKLQADIDELRKTTTTPSSGDTNLPPGYVRWVGAPGKALVLWSKGGAGYIDIKAGDAPLSLTGGAASTWKTTAGALSLDGYGGINFKANNTTLADLGVTLANYLTLGENVTLAGVAGTGGLSLGAMTGATALPTGNLSWAGASGKTCSLVADGAMTLTAGASSVWKTTTGSLTLDGASYVNIGTTLASAVNLGRSGQTVAFFGVSGSTRVTCGANLTNSVTSGGTDSTIANFTDLSTYGNDAAAIRNNIYQLARSVKIIQDGLRAYGLLT